MSNSTSPVETPSLKRRLICLVYETSLVIAVAALGILLFLLATQKLGDSVIYYGRHVALFAVVGVYLVHSWAGTGFTLAMKTWRIKLVKVGCARVPMKAAIVRYVFAWGWVLPALAVSDFFHLSRGQTGAAIGVGIVAWALTAFLDKDRQFLHDKIAGTRLISLPKPE
ncbi:MAG: RDD family protein [Telluria sp.]|nr:RDD family protein [Telluria sp.]